MDEIGSFDAKNKFSELLAKAERGEEIVITRSWPRRWPSDVAGRIVPRS